MTEIWKPTPGFDKYEVSDLGRIRLVVAQNNRPAGHIMKSRPESNGYWTLGLSRPEGRKGCLVHRLVCAAFHGPAPSPLHEAAHGDGNKDNNTPGNLRWATKAENQRDRLAHGTDSRGERHPMVKLTEADVAAIRREPRLRGSGRSLARTFGVTPAAISAIRNGKLWRHVA